MIKKKFNLTDVNLTIDFIGKECNYLGIPKDNIIKTITIMQNKFNEFIGMSLVDFHNYGFTTIDEVKQWQKYVNGEDPTEAKIIQVTIDELSQYPFIKDVEWSSITCVQNHGDGLVIYVNGVAIRLESKQRNERTEVALCNSIFTIAETVNNNDIWTKLAIVCITEYRHEIINGIERKVKYISGIYVTPFVFLFREQTKINKDAHIFNISNSGRITGALVANEHVVDKIGTYEPAVFNEEFKKYTERTIQFVSNQKTHN